MTLSWITIILQLFFLEGILSIDNAAVLGAMVVPLPRDRGVPWPRALRPLGRMLNPVLGPQQQAALKVGLLGAYLGRGVMLLAAHIVIQNPWLRLLGGLYLVYLAVDHLARNEDDGGKTDEASRRTAGQSFWRVVLAVELADLAFSLDNVVAAVALSNHIVAVMIGVAFGILTMRFAAGLFTAFVQREPILEPTAYVLVLVIGGLLILQELFHFQIPALLQFGMSLSILLLAVLYQHWRPLQALRPLLLAAQRLLSVAMAAFRLATRPVGALVSMMSTLIQSG
ncbi:MAG: DUF475 domain-containing protein [Ardenticatenaceae bacterium]|nr:DUF475 domain-containing protein [Ardenticatenaceae bacterium]HBY97895.1 tellurium resistance protein TerC [Chloroflexota bacterium]